MNSAVLAALCLVLAAPPAHGKVLHVVPRASAGGDGSVKKPLGALEQALAMAAPGDTIRVAAGLYVVRAGSALLLEQPGLTVEGGHDVEFTKRDPFGTPSVVEPAQETGQPLILVEPAAANTTLDGLTLDGAPGNSYSHGGAVLESPRRWTPLLRIHRGQGVTIRNCTFLNGPGHAISTSVASHVLLSNNVMVNHRVSAVTAWGVLQDARLSLVGNTIVGVWPETPDGTRGAGIDVQQRLVVDMRANAITNIQGHCMRFGLGVDMPQLVGNVLGSCSQGHVVGWPGGQTPVVAHVQELGITGWLHALGNLPLAQPLSADGTSTTLSLPAHASPATTDGGSPAREGWVPYAPRHKGPVSGLVGAIKGAGVQPEPIR